MPVDVFIGEAQGTLAGARLHAARLATIGFPERWMRQAEEGLALLVEAQTNWLATRRRGREAAESVVLARATALRRELLATAAYALRHNGPARQKVAAIRKGVSLYDLAQDLKNIAALIKHNAPAFEEVRFDFARCAEARATSDELLKAHAASVTRGTRGDAKERRNRAFTATATVLAEIRAAGLYVLRNENRPDWLAMFRSRHEVQRGQRDRARGKKRPQASDLALRSAPAPKPEA